MRSTRCNGRLREVTIGAADSEFAEHAATIADAKQLFEQKRTGVVTDTNPFIKKSSAKQTKSGTPGPCPLCKETTTRDLIYDNSYT